MERRIGLTERAGWAVQSAAVVLERTIDGQAKTREKPNFSVCGRHSGKGSPSWTMRMRWSVKGACMLVMTAPGMWQVTQFFVPTGHALPG